MGCTSSLFETPVGRVVITMKPADNLDVGSFELISGIELNRSMFKKKKTKASTDDGDGDTTIPTYRIQMQPLMGPITKLSIQFEISKEFYVENGKVDIALTRDGTVLATKGLFGRDDNEPFRLNSVTYGSTTGNPVVNLSQAGDYYEIRIFLK